jgi:hypothetical protein
MWSEHGAKIRAAVNDLLRPVAERRETATAHKPERVTQQTRVLQVLPTVFPPDGHPPIDLSLQEIQNRMEEEFKKRRLRLASTDTIARALGRRRRG